MNRRDFMKTTVIASATAALARPGEAKTVAPSDRLAIGVIGCGARAHEHLQNLVEMPGVEVVAVCDAYKGRAERAKSRTGGRATIVQDYHEILAMPGVDAVFIVTPDHWHKTMAVEALAAKKDIYLEKPMSYSIEDGLGILDAVKHSDRIVQIGSQSVSGPDMIKARELVKAGKIGQVVEVRAAYNRNSAGGAWLYPIPPDASPQTVNWDQFLGPAPKRPFDLEPLLPVALLLGLLGRHRDGPVRPSRLLDALHRRREDAQGHRRHGGKLPLPEDARGARHGERAAALPGRLHREPVVHVQQRARRGRRGSRSSARRAACCCAAAR